MHTIYDAATGVQIEVKERHELKPPSQRLDELLYKDRGRLYELSTVFPFDLFTDKIIISRTKVDLVYGVFFFSEHVISMLVKDLKNVKVTTGIFFASMSFELQGYEKNPPAIKFLQVHKAVRARRIIEGLIICETNKIDLKELPSSDLIAKLEDLGKAREK